jgi:hypothetical protein
LGVGFDLRVAHRPGGSLRGQPPSSSGSTASTAPTATTAADERVAKEDVCSWTFTGDGLNDEGGGEGLFLSPEHWYPPGTNCTYLIKGEPGQVARLYFPSFKVNRIENPVDGDVPGDCRESLTLYDDSWANGRKVIKTFCDGFSRPLERHDFVSTANALFVVFSSRTGSYSGSALQFWAQYDFFDSRTDGQRVTGTVCDEIISAADVGTFRSPRNTLVYKVGENQHVEESPGHVICRYEIRADERVRSRLKIAVNALALKGQGGGCEEDADGGMGDKVEVVDPYGDGRGPLICLEAGQEPGPPLYSRGPRLILTLRVDAANSALNYFKSDDPLFVASYESLHPPRECGPVVARGGSLTYPALGAAGSAPVTCVWDILGLPFVDARLDLLNVTLPGHSCEDASLEIVDGGDGGVHYSVCAGGNATGGGRVPPLKSRSPPKVRLFSAKPGASFQLRWRTASIA